MLQILVQASYMVCKEGSSILGSIPCSLPKVPKTFRGFGGYVSRKTGHARKGASFKPLGVFRGTVFDPGIGPCLLQRDLRHGPRFCMCNGVMIPKLGPNTRWP